MPIWLDELLEPPSQLHRSTPYNYGDPMLLKQRIRIKVNQELAVEAKSWTSKTDAFELQQDSSFHDQTLEINYTYRTTKESIPANRMEAFTASIKQLREHLGYYVSLNEKPGSDYRLNWMGLFLLVLLTGVIGYVCFRIASIPGKPALVVAAPSHLQGLGGWLILVGISLVLRPFSLASTSLHTVQPLLNLSRWQLLTDPEASSYHAVLPPLLLAEATFNVFLLASSITVLILFFRKSYQFPKWMCVILITAAVGQCGDTVASSLLFSDKNLSSEQIRAMAQSLVGALIWVPYFLVSKRVKATFIEDRLPLPEDKKTTPEQEVV